MLHVFGYDNKCEGTGGASPSHAAVYSFLAMQLTILTTWTGLRGHLAGRRTPMLPGERLRCASTKRARRKATTATPITGDKGNGTI